MANDTLLTSRAAIDRHDWQSALDALTQFETSDGSLPPDDLVNMGDALWWTGKPDQAIEVFERAFAAFESEGRPSDSAQVGSLLAYLAFRRQAFSIAFGWIARVERILEGQPESAGHAWINLLYLAKTLMVDGDLESAIHQADEVIDISRRLGVRGVQSLAMSFKGIAMIQKGDWRAGITLIDEATVVAMSGEGDLRAASDVYCNTIAACRNLADYRRAGEWTEEADRWMKTNSVGGYTGVCQVHRAELKRLHGSWPEAEQDARRACTELQKFHLLDSLGYAYYEIGEVRRRMGDLVAAEDAFAQAYEHGASAQPGLALLLLDKGEAEEAAKSISGALKPRADEVTAGPPLARGRLLPALVEIAIATGDLETARAATDELDEFARHYESPTWEASALSCRGSLAVTEGHMEEAVDLLSRAWRLWQEADLPYEAARTRVMLGQARQGLGDRVSADLEFRAARSAFHKLGAAADLRRLDDLTGAARPGGTAGDRLKKAFMFTDIVTSTDLIGIIGDAAWENLLRWHDRALREEFGSHSGDEVRHTGDGFFVAFDRPRDAIECAVSIQRRLDANRRDHGFAPLVRIGVHYAEATMKGGDYTGQGIHAAARVGAMAQGEEIVVSADLLDVAGTLPYSVTDAESASLKGIAEPIEVYRIDWH